MPTYSINNLQEYLSELRVTKPVEKGVMDSISIVTKVFMISPEFFLLEDAINTDGRREFIGVVLLTRAFWSEASLTPNEPGIFISSIYKSISTLSLSDRVAETEITESSRLSLYASFQNGGSLQISATGMNCKELITACQDFLLPNLTGHPLCQPETLAPPAKPTARRVHSR